MKVEAHFCIALPIGDFIRRFHLHGTVCHAYRSTL